MPAKQKGIANKLRRSELNSDSDEDWGAAWPGTAEPQPESQPVQAQPPQDILQVPANEGWRSQAAGNAMQVVAEFDRPRVSRPRLSKPEGPSEPDVPQTVLGGPKKGGQTKPLATLLFRVRFF